MKCFSLRHILIILLAAPTCSISYADATSPGIILATEFDDSAIYTGMTVEYTVKLFIDPATEVQSYIPVKELTLEGCNVEYSPNVPETPTLEATPDGKEYTSVVIERIYITPDRAGEYYIPALEYNIDAMEGMIVNHPYMGRQLVYNPAGYNMFSQPISFRVKDLPDNAPDGFSGIIGEFNYSARCSTESASINDLITVVLSITGQGNISDITLPALENSAINLPCEISEPYRTFREQKAGNNMMGVVRYTYTLKPLASGRLEIALPELVYLDTTTESYISAGEKTLAIEIKESNVDNM